MSRDSSGLARVRAAFEAAAAAGRPAFIAYVLAGHRTEGESLAVAAAALAAGADILEIGVPFSDPLADGPTIADASRAAAAAGMGLASALRLAASLRDQGFTQPLLAMSYRNPVLAVGPGAPRTMVAAGFDGAIVPDLPAGEDLAFERSSRQAGLALCFLVGPNSDDARVRTVARASTGFVYVVPRYGVTGARQDLGAGAVDLVGRVRRIVDGRAPVAAGFGISAPEHVVALAPVADGVVVGSLLVAAVTHAGPGEAPLRVGDEVRRLASTDSYAKVGA
ncbi:MAG TPA: tryptophan synthase subunit alpha [Candidatus Limnocylindrales bacterium]|nr:tryptophan synthase subunit alpha [Candidatus Limnocylindrales bacterium]